MKKIKQYIAKTFKLGLFDFAYIYNPTGAFRIIGTREIFKIFFARNETPQYKYELGICTLKSEYLFLIKK